MYVYDGPGIEMTDTNGRPLPRRVMGTGDYLSVYQIRVGNKKTNEYDAKRYYYDIIIRYKDGEATEYEVRELTKEEYDNAQAALNK